MSFSRTTLRRRAFSLIEVLIGIVVLALGLVGLAAVFPTVVRQQQVASDQVVGLSAARSAEAYFRGQLELQRPVSHAGNVGTYGSGPVSVTPDFYGQVDWRDLVGLSILTWDQGWSNVGQWSLATGVAPAAANGGVTVDPATGNALLGRVPQLPDSTNTEAVIRGVLAGGIRVPLADRLLPGAQPGNAKAVQPRFVWDFAMRRVDLGTRHLTTGQPEEIRPTYRDDGVEIALFVRRIDVGIRVPPGRTVSDVLLGATGVAASERRVPVGADATTGVPSLDGLGGATPNYSLVQSISFAIVTSGNASKTDTIDLSGNTPILPYAAQFGQVFVDQLGGTHKVVEVLDAPAADRVRVRVEPEFRSDYFNVVTQDPAMRPYMRALIFTPQVPASVVVFTIPPVRKAAS